MHRGITTRKTVKKWLIKYSLVLVLVQVSAIGVVIMTTPLQIYKLYTFLPFGIFSVFLLFWAVISMKATTWNIMPGLRKKAEPTFRGPYKTVRHPMYLAIITFAVPLCINHYTHLRLMAILVLFTTLILKIELEEQLLKERFPGYHNYSDRTYRLIPYIF